MIVAKFTANNKENQKIMDTRSNIQSVDVIVKFGGSAITDKGELESLKPNELRIASELIKQCHDAGLTCIVVHGAG